jgi:hypothetical protein
LCGAAVWIACGGAYGDDPALAVDGGPPDAPVLDSGGEAPVVARDSGPLDAADDRVVLDGGVDGASCSTNECDCDKDGFPVQRLGCTSPDAAFDCDDLDSRRRPNQDYLADPPDAHLGDWNCNKLVEKMYPVNVNCGGGIGAVCATMQGFTTDPPCGKEGTFVTCVSNLLVCQVQSTTVRTQACK